jgi:CheY-like chemotaxis protein
MPGMNGWQLVERLRDAGQKAPILMLSANIGDAPASGGEGHDDAIAKPVDITRLRDKLAMFLGLDWIYADDPRLLAPAAALQKPSSPGHAHLDELIRLCEIGYVRGIEAKLAELSTESANTAFVETSRSYLQAFDLAGLRGFLTSFETGKEPIHG